MFDNQKLFWPVLMVSNESTHAATSVSFISLVYNNHTDYDCILHVNPYITNRGLAMIFNPTQSTISRSISLPLYYTGISNKAMVLHEGQTPGTVIALERDYSIQVSVEMAAQTVTWVLIQSAD